MTRLLKKKGLAQTIVVIMILVTLFAGLAMNASAAGTYTITSLRSGCVSSGCATPTTTVWMTVEQYATCLNGNHWRTTATPTGAIYDPVYYTSLASVPAGSSYMQITPDRALPTPLDQGDYTVDLIVINSGDTLNWNVYGAVPITVNTGATLNLNANASGTITVNGGTVNVADGATASTVVGSGTGEVVVAGTANVSGSFDTITVNAGVLNVTGETYSDIETNNGIVNVNANTSGDITMNGATVNVANGVTANNVIGTANGTNNLNVTGTAYAQGTFNSIAGISGTAGIVEMTGDITNNGAGNGITYVGTSSGNGYNLSIDSGEANLRGNFASLTYVASPIKYIIVGDTVVKSTENENIFVGLDSDPKNLTITAVNTGTAYVEGTFANLVTGGHKINLAMSDDLVINGTGVGYACVEGDEDYVLTVNNGTVEAYGYFKQIVANGGTVTDCDELLIYNNNAPALIIAGADVTLNDGGTIISESNLNSPLSVVSISSGSLTLGYDVGETGANYYDISLVGETTSNSNTGVHVTGGTFNFDSGIISGIAGTSARGVYTYGAGAVVNFGEEGSTGAYNADAAPAITLREGGSYGIYAASSSTANIYNGYINLSESGNGYGIYVSAANGYVHTNNATGSNTLGANPLLFVNASTAMHVTSGSSFEIRGRGGLFAGSTNALRIAGTPLNAANYPLSGGTFYGKISYQSGDISDLILHNHYARYDGKMADEEKSDWEGEILVAAKNSFTFTDGAYGIRPSAMATSEALNVYGSAEYNDGYLSNLGAYGNFITITDAEWELRAAMASSSNTAYQIPAGIIRSGASTDNTITLGINAGLDIWGIGDIDNVSANTGADVDVTGGNHTLYLAGRTVRYIGANYENETSYFANAATAGNDSVFAVASGLTIKDAVLGGTGTTWGEVEEDVAEDKYNGAYIGTGKILYEYTQSASVVYAIKSTSNTAALTVISAEIAANGEYSRAVFSQGTATFGTAATKDDNFEDENNILVYVHSNGGYANLQIVAGATTIHGGLFGGYATGGAKGIYVEAGALNINGGVISGNMSNGIGLEVWDGVTTISGGNIYADYGTTGTSIEIVGGTVYLNIDEDHQNYEDIFEHYDDADLTEDEGNRANLTSYGRHYIGNVVNNGGTLYVGIADALKPVVTGYSRISGNLTVEGKDSKTASVVFYDGIVCGTTTVTLVDSYSKMYVADGDFYSLVVNGTVADLETLHTLVQLHGGVYGNLSVDDVVCADSASATINDIIGDWIYTRQFNHYGVVNSTEGRSEAEEDYGVYTEVAFVSDDAIYGPEAFKYATAFVGEGDYVVVIKNAAVDFVNWLESDTTVSKEYDYKLIVDIWLGEEDTAVYLGSNIPEVCNPYFECYDAVHGKDSAYPLVVGAGAHNLDMNSLTVAGSVSGTMIEVNQDSGVFTISNSDDSANDDIAALLANIAADGTLIEVKGSKLVVNLNVNFDDELVDVMMASTVISQSGGEVVLNGGAVSSTAINGCVLTGGTMTLDGVNINGFAPEMVFGRGNGIYMTGGTLNINKPATEEDEFSTVFGYRGIWTEGGTVNMYGGAVVGTEREGIFMADATVNVSGGAVFGANTAADISVNLYTGAITVESGTLNLSGDADVAGVDWNEQDSGDIVGAPYGVYIQGGTANISGTVEIYGESTGVNIEGGTANISGSTYIDGYSVGIYIDNGTLNLSGNGTVVSEDAIWQDGGSVTVTGSPVLLGDCCGLFKSGGTTTLNGGVYSSINNNAQIPDGFEDDGTTPKFRAETLADIIVPTSIIHGVDLEEGTNSGSLAESLWGEHTWIQDGNSLTDGQNEVEAESLFKLNQVTNYVPGPSLPSQPLIKTDHFAYMIGNTAGQFKPDSKVTRAEIAMIFYRLLTDKSAGTEVVSFSDVADDAWYAEAVNVLASRGIILGYKDGTFHPNASITRAEVAAIAARFDELSKASITFSDVPETHWAYNEISSAAAKGWVEPYADGTFRPGEAMIRADVVVFINNVLGRNPDKEFIDANEGKLTREFSDVDSSHPAYYDIIEASNAHDYTVDNAGEETWTELRDESAK